MKKKQLKVKNKKTSLSSYQYPNAK